MTTLSPPRALHCPLQNLAASLLGWAFLNLLALTSAAAQCPLTVNAGPDQFFCTSPATFTLAGAVTGIYQQVSWVPALGDSLNPSGSINQTTTYILTAKTADFGQNLVQNGDFEQGNVGFTSDYPFNGGFAVWPPFGTYDVAPVPVGIMPCRDHATGLGNYMFADGADQPNLLFWCQTVPVTPNTDYLLSSWATSMNPDIPFAELQFSINGGIVGNMTAPAQCTWAEFTGLWNSGNATTANICIENLNLQLGQNDFGIDDIGFFPLCSVSDTITLHISPVTAAAQVADTLDCLVKTLTLSSMGSSTGPEIRYLWSTPDGQIVGTNTAATATAGLPGTYILLVSDTISGCSSTDTLTVLENTQGAIVQIQTPALLTCKTTTQTLTAQATGGGNMTYAWGSSNGGNITMGADTPTPTISAAGTYTVTVTNLANGCTGTANTAVQADKQAPDAALLLPQTLTCLRLLDTLQVANVDPNFNYAWTASGGGQFVSGENTASPIVSAPGNYLVTVTNPTNGCSSTGSLTVLQNTAVPMLSIQTPTLVTCKTTTQTLTAQATGGGNVSFAWVASNGGSITAGANTLTPTISGTGTYTLTTTGPINGCTATASVTVSADTLPPSISIAAPAALNCTTAVVTLTATAQLAGSYAWSGSGIVSGGSTPMPSVNAIGTYTVTATHPTNGCTATAATTVSENKTAPTFSIASPPVLTCAAPIAQLLATVSQPSSSFSAQWATLSGNILSGGNTLQPSVNALGVYTLTVQNQQNGCTATVSATVMENKVAPVSNITSFPVLTCSPPQVTLVATADAGGAAMSFQWLGPLIVSGGTTLMPSVGASGNYTLVVTNQTNGCTGTASATVNSDTLRPTVVIAPPALLTCLTLELLLDATASSSGPDFTLNWATTGGKFVSGETTLSPTVNQPGEYTLLISNLKNGCTRSVAVAVVRNTTPPIAEAGPPKMLHCQQLQVQLMGSSTPAAVQYSWAGPGILSGATTAAPTVDQAGSYTLTVTRSDNGCTDTDEVEVTTLPLPDFEAELKNPYCNSPTGQILFTQVAGGQSPYTFSINGGSSFQSIPGFGGLKNGSYALVMRDQFGCTATQNVDLLSGTPPVVQLPTSITLALGESDTLLPITVPPASNIAQWLWSPGDFLSCTDCPTPVITPLRSQRYTLTVTDAGGCTGSATVQVLVSRRRDVYAPNVFSPNGDGYNDGFTLYGRGTVRIREVEIFDRWGSLVWRAEGLPLGDESLGWDGQVRGQAASPGVFVWKAVVEFLDGLEEQFSGDVTVLR